MKRFAIRVAVLLLVAVVAATAANAVRSQGIRWFVSRDEVYPPRSKEVVSQAIARDEVRAAIDAGVTVIDARSEDKYLRGHIPFARNLPSESAESRIAEAFQWSPDPTAPVIVYCGGDECDESEHVYKVLKDSGFTNLRLYFGGWRDWLEAGMPVEEGAREP